MAGAAHGRSFSWSDEAPLAGLQIESPGLVRAIEAAMSDQPADPGIEHGDVPAGHVRHRVELRELHCGSPASRKDQSNVASGRHFAAEGVHPLAVANRGLTEGAVAAFQWERPRVQDKSGPRLSA